MLADLKGYAPLRIQTTSDQDIPFISACLQDMSFPYSALDYNVETKTFIGVGNRFCWESAIDFDSIGHYYRVHSSFKIEHVENVYTKNIKSKILSILMLTYHDRCIHFVFSDHQELKIEVSSILFTVKDLQMPWITETKPEHI